MIVLWFAIIGVVVAWLTYVTKGAIIYVPLLASLAWTIWDAAPEREHGASWDVAYYCDVLGTDQTTDEWKNVYEWTRYDERFEPTTDNYSSVFSNTGCNTAIGELGKVDKKHSKLGYIYRYYRFENGNAVSLYRDTKQFLWQRALMLRIDENCGLNRETGVCHELPEIYECDWSDVYSTYSKCEYDTTGRGNHHDIQDDNFIIRDEW